MSRGPTKKERRRTAFGSSYALLERYMEGKRTKRLHFLTSREADEVIKRESGRLGITMSDYVLYRALTFKTGDITGLLGSAILKLDRCIEANNIKLNKGATVMNEVKNFKKDNVANAKTEQYHLRVTPDAYEKLIARANEYSMSVSDYITFIICHFDISEISLKIEEINSRLDAICKKAV